MVPAIIAAERNKMRRCFRAAIALLVTSSWADVFRRKPVVTGFLAC
jgi:RNase P protein component